MGRTFVRQDVQIGSTADTTAGFNDGVAPSLANYETNPANLVDDLNNLRSVASYLKSKQSGAWYDALVVPSALESGTQRGIDDLNNALHAVEKKRVLRDVHSLADIAVGGADNFVILGVGQIPSQTTAAVGTVTTLGTVVAPHGGTFGTHSLAEVAGTSSLNPKNLLAIFDGATRDPILSDNRIVWGLLQGESGVVDGATITAATTTRVQISFVRINASGDDLEVCPAADIQGRTINYCYRERVRLENLNEGDFLKGAIVDAPGSAFVSRQASYANQGTTPVDLATNAFLDLSAPGIAWAIRDDAAGALFTITEGSAGGTSKVEVNADADTFKSSAVVNEFTQGATFNSAGARDIRIGVADGIIDTVAGDLEVRGAAELYLDDGNQGGSTWAQTAGIKLSDTTAEWDDFETRFGEVSILDAIKQAGTGNRIERIDAVVTTNVAADTDVSGPSEDNNLDADLGDLSDGSFVGKYDIFLNGVLLRNGANAAANHDVYPGTSLANGQLKFEFALKGTGAKPDRITVLKYT